MCLEWTQRVVSHALGLTIHSGIATAAIANVIEATHTHTHLKTLEDKCLCRACGSGSVNSLVFVFLLPVRNAIFILFRNRIFFIFFFLFFFISHMISDCQPNASTTTTAEPAAAAVAGVGARLTAGGGECGCGCG